MRECGWDEDEAEKFEGLLLSPTAVLPTGFFVCETCHNRLEAGELPAWAIANGNAIYEDYFAAEKISDVEACLINPVALRVLLLELQQIGDPAARQKGLGSHATFFAADPNLAVSEFLPRPPEQLPHFITVYLSRQQLQRQPLRSSRALERIKARPAVILSVIQRMMERNPSLQHFRVQDNQWTVETELFETEDGYVAVPRNIIASTDRADRASDEHDRGFLPQHQRDDQTTNVCAQPPPTFTAVQPAPANLASGPQAFFLSLGQLVKDQNPAVLDWAFAHDIPFGEGGVSAARSVRLGLKKWIQRALSLSSMVFAQDLRFVGAVADVYGRRKMMPVAVMSASPEEYEAYSRISAAEYCLARRYLDDCEAALRRGVPKPPYPGQPGTAAAVRMVRRAQKTLVHLPNSEEERQSGGPRLDARCYAFGNPHSFTTLNPDDTNAPALPRNVAKGLAHLRQVDEEGRLHVFDEVTFGSRAERKACIAENPVGCADWFIDQLEAFIYSLLGWDSKNHCPRKGGGVFGTVLAFVVAIETQQRGGLHAHILLWLKSAPRTTAELIELMQDAGRVENLNTFLSQTSTQRLLIPPRFMQCPHCSAGVEFLRDEVAEIGAIKAPLPRSTPEPPLVSLFSRWLWQDLYELCSGRLCADQNG